MASTCHCELIGLYNQKHNKLVTVALHYLMMIIIVISITLSPLTHFCFHIHSSFFAVSVHTL